MLQKLLKKHTLSALQTTLIELDRQIARCGEDLGLAKAKVERLDAVIANASPQEATLNRLMADDDGTALEKLAAGEADAPDITSLIERVHRASQAATAARVALPGAHAAMDAVTSRLEGLQRDRQAKVMAVALEEADKVAAAYKRAFDRLVELHDELRGASMGIALSGGEGFILVNQVLEAPRFELPALRCDEGFSTFLRAVPNDQNIRARASWWRGMIALIGNDPAADLRTADIVEDPESMKKPTEIFLTVREREDEKLTLADTIHAPRWDRPSLAGQPT